MELHPRRDRWLRSLGGIEPGAHSARELNPPVAMNRIAAIDPQKTHLGGSDRRRRAVRLGPAAPQRSSRQASLERRLSLAIGDGVHPLHPHAGLPAHHLNELVVLLPLHLTRGPGVGDEGLLALITFWALIRGRRGHNQAPLDDRLKHLTQPVQPLIELGQSSLLG